MDDIFHKYTAGELLQWLENEDLDIYIKQEAVEVDNDVIIMEKLDIEQVKANFLRNIRRYEVIKRGKKFYIHDNRDCKDIMVLHFNDDDYEYVQNTANNIVESLNNREIHFVGTKHHCG